MYFDFDKELSYFSLRIVSPASSGSRGGGGQGRRGPRPGAGGGDSIRRCAATARVRPQPTHYPISSRHPPRSSPKHIAPWLINNAADVVQNVSLRASTGARGREWEAAGEFFSLDTLKACSVCCVVYSNVYIASGVPHLRGSEEAFLRSALAAAARLIDSWTARKRSCHGVCQLPGDAFDALGSRNFNIVNITAPFSHEGRPPSPPAARRTPPSGARRQIKNEIVLRCFY
ncbi:hypothetical protein EVAR_51854_1 [Eumeta japonica]|uniref:Uncharacterized protein n=1 Tax=Eumeta variegata TaxID=151549 RepID=A0A4C1YRL4_EUMVA|nr:hypothetical protein EVAR_51854_1 [Eumeta japonica]